jgi:hypothetical protein
MDQGFLENIVLRIIFGSKSNEVDGWWRKLHDKVGDLHSSPTIIRAIK